MSICVYGITALEILRSSGRLLPDLLECPRTSSIEDCRAASEVELNDLLPRLGARTKPYHLLAPSGSSTYDYKNVCRHRVYVKLPRASLIKVQSDVLVPSPELVFCQLAATKLFDEVDLALIGTELCGTYVLDASPDSWKGFTNLLDAPTSRDKISRCLDAYGRRPGVPLAARALDLVIDGSNSPMETVLAALLTFPRRLGGYALPGVKMNYRVSLPGEERYIDMAFPMQRVGLEYKGRLYHGIEQSSRDDRRQNGLVGSGWTIINVWYEDLLESHLFGALVSNLSKALGVRIRVRSNCFEARQELLRTRLIPGLKRYSN